MVPELTRWDLPRGSVMVRRSGHEGAPGVVLVHGLGGSSLNWLSLMERLGDGADLVAVDLPGFGASPPPHDGDYSPSGHGRSVAAVISSLQQRRGSAQPVHLVGNSLGGAVSLQVAARRPDLVASLTLISPALPTVVATRGNVHLPVVALPGLGEELLRRYGGSSAEARVQATLEACFSDADRVPREHRQLLVEEVRLRDRLPYANDAFLSSLRGLLATFLDPGPRRPWALAARVTAPVLAVYGEEDILVPARSAHHARRAIPHASVVVLPDCGHAAQMEHPEVVATLWTTMANSTPAGTPYA